MSMFIVMLEMTSRLALHRITISGQVQNALMYNYGIPMAGAWHTLCSHCIIAHACAQLIARFAAHRLDSPADHRALQLLITSHSTMQ